MNIIQKSFAGITAAALLLSATPAFAQGTSTAPASSTAAQTRITTAKNRADQEITRRLAALNDLNASVQAMTKLSSDEIAAISSSISSAISDLTALQTKIDADTDLATLKTDIKSITASYRVFVLVIPQGRIEVAADKIANAASTLGALASKLQTRISAAQTAGSDVTALSASLSDMNAKLADANTQATAAASHVSSLTPDNGNQTTLQANNAALKLARADIKVGLQDLQAARKDAGSIVAGLKGLGTSMTATSTSTQ